MDSAMAHVEAVYRNGVFEPLEPVQLPEEQRVRLSIEPAGEETPQSWLNSIRELQAAIVRRQGPLPDSASDIAADRLR
jgi:predicted DNA-binding antitoxin AbrB/MazE fold protein